MRFDMKRFFTSDLSCGVLTASIAACLTAIFPGYYWLTLALLSLTHGIAVRNLGLCVFGFIASVVLLNVFELLYGELYWPYIYSIPPRYYLHVILQYTMPVLGALMGAALTIWREKLTLVAIFSSFAAVVILTVAAASLHALLPEESRQLEKWQFVSIILFVPIVGIGLWWPIEIIRAKTRRRF
jgi:hypothetical protein